MQWFNKLKAPPIIPEDLRRVAQEFSARLELGDGTAPKELTERYLPAKEVEKILARQPKGLADLVAVYMETAGLNPLPSEDPQEAAHQQLSDSLLGLKIGVFWLKDGQSCINGVLEFSHGFYNSALQQASATLRNKAEVLETFALMHPEEIARLEKAVLEKDPAPKGKDLQNTIRRLRETADWAEQEFVPRWTNWAARLDGIQRSIQDVSKN